MDKKTMRNYKPRRPGTTLEDVMTEEGRARRDAARQGVADAKMQPKLDAAYEAASTVGKKCGGSVKKYAKGGEVDNDEKSKKPKRTAKDIVNRMEVKRMMPVTNAMLSGAEKVLDRIPEGGLRDLGVGVTTGAMVPTMMADLPIAALRGTKPRKKEDEDELVREVRRTQGGYKKGGSVRGAGAATKGIRKCKIR